MPKIKNKNVMSFHYFVFKASVVSSTTGISVLLASKYTVTYIHNIQSLMIMICKSIVSLQLHDQL